jgi:hypothetical protein
LRPSFHTLNPSHRHPLSDVPPPPVSTSPSRPLPSADSLLFPLMAPPSDDEITTHAEAARVATKATTARQAVDAELTRFTTEADCLTTDVARVQQDADRARRALVGTSLDLVPPQPDDASIVPAAPMQTTIVAALHA